MENFPYQYRRVPYQNGKLIFHSGMESFPFTNGKSDFSIPVWNFFLCVSSGVADYEDKDDDDYTMTLLKKKETDRQSYRIRAVQGHRWWWW